MSLLMDALRRAERAKEQVQAGEQGEVAPVVTAANSPSAVPASPPARLVSGGGAAAVPSGREPAAGRDDPLILSIDEVTPVATDAAVVTRAGHSQEALPQAVSSIPVTAPSGQTATHLQARLMLAARARQSRRRRLGYMVGGGVVLLLVVLAFVYFDVVVSTGRLHEPQIALPLSGQETVQPAAVEEGDVPEGPEEIVSPNGTADTAVVPAPAVVRPATTVQNKSGVSHVQSKRTPATTAEMPSAQATTVADARASSPVVIVRNQTEDPLQLLLAQAFDDYQAGNDQQAEAGYRQALARDPSSRDALLGLAALAQRGDQSEEARLYYRRLLELNPMDSTPVAGLIGLRDSTDPVQDESQIKLLLKQEPAAAHLHFALGTLYVAQARWADAQQAFFDAYSRDPANADYAFNLAVCLDRLGQTSAALDYYRRTIDLARGHATSFKDGEVARRIEVLTAAVRGDAK